MKNILLILTGLVVSMPLAADQEDILFNVVSLQAEAQRQVNNNEMTVYLQAEYEGSDSTAVANTVNNKMQWALQQAQQFPDIELQTHSYSTYPVYNKNIISGWRAHQSVRLVGQNAKKMTDLVAILQAKLLVKNMSFAPTRAAYRSAEHALIEQAMAVFKAKVEIIQGTMEKKNFRIVNIDIVTDQRQPQHRRGNAKMMTSLADSNTRPGVSSGTSKVTVTVSGKVQFF